MKLVHQGKPLWAPAHSRSVSYVYENDDGSQQVEVVQFGDNGKIVLYPAGIDTEGRAVKMGSPIEGLLSAQVLALEILGPWA